MHKFKYRSPRIVVDLPIQLEVEKSTIGGRCRDISSEGMGLELRQVPTRNARGTVLLSHQGRVLELGVRVVRNGARDGVEFIYGSEAERSAVLHLVASLAAPQDRPRPVLVAAG